MDLITALLVVGICYISGSIPTAYIATRIVVGKDIRDTGSGNVGATNAMRLLGKKWGIGILVFDALKGLIPLLIIQHAWLQTDPLLERYSILGALFCLVGHIYPVWLRFRGGKGVATGFGVMVALLPIPIALCASVFVVTVFISRMVSAGSILAALTLPFAFFLKYNLGEHTELFVFTVFAALFVIYKHKSNIKRIFAGVENRLGEKHIPNQEE